GACAARSRLAQTEGLSEDVREDAGYLIEMQKDHDQAEKDVQDRHEGDKALNRVADAAYPTEDHRSGACHQAQAHQNTQPPAGGANHRLDRITDGHGDAVGLHRVEEQTEPDGDEYREQHGHPSLFDPVEQVMGRATSKAGAGTNLVQLGKSGLHEGGPAQKS